MPTISLTDGLNTFTWDGSAPGANVNRMSGFEYHSLRTVIEDTPNREGSTHISTKAGRRIFSWEGVISGSSQDNWLTRRRNLIKVLQTDGLKTFKITTDDSLELQVDAEISDFVMDQPQEFISYGRYFIQMVAPDYRFFSQDVNESTTGPTSSTGGTAIPTPVPMDLSTTTGTPRLVVNNSGTVRTDPTFRITGPGTTFVVQNITTSEQLNYNATLSSGEFVDIDIKNRTALQGGSTNVYGNVTGDWWDLEPGNNTIHFNAVSGTDANTLLRVQHRDAYNGL